MGYLGVMEGGEVGLYRVRQKKAPTVKKSVFPWVQIVWGKFQMDMVVYRKTKSEIPFGVVKDFTL